MTISFNLASVWSEIFPSVLLREFSHRTDAETDTGSTATKAEKSLQNQPPDCSQNEQRDRHASV